MAQTDRERVFQGKHFVFIGDSLSRYLYLSVLYMLHHKHWLDTSMYPNPVEEKTYESWPIYFRSTNGLFDPYHYCDCSREQQYENRYYINKHSNLYLSYFLYYGKNFAVHSRWSPPNDSIVATVNGNVSQYYMNNLTDAIGICSNSLDDPNLWNYEFSDLLDLFSFHISNLKPTAPLPSNESSRFPGTNGSASKLYAIVMNAGFWPSRFNEVEYAKRIVSAAFAVAHRFIWRTTTFTQFDRTKKREFDLIDEIMCGLPRVECLDVSWTRSADRSLYWDDKHFRAGVYNKIADQLVRHLAGNSSGAAS